MLLTKQGIGYAAPTHSALADREKTVETTSRATGKWSQPGVPHKGWTCLDIEDLGEPSATCEMCEAQEIRYVHHMEHPNYSGSLGCGCVCAGPGGCRFT